MDILTVFLAANVALCALTIVGFALTKEGVTQRIRETLASANLAGIAGAACGVLTMSSVSAMFL